MVLLLKAWAWLKSNYMILVVMLVAAIIGHLYISSRNAAIHDAYRQQSEALQEQIWGLQQIIDAEVQQNQQNLDNYYAELLRIEESYSERLKQLEADRDKAKKKYNTLYKEDIKKFIDAIEKRYGIKFAE